MRSLRSLARPRNELPAPYAASSRGGAGSGFAGGSGGMSIDAQLQAMGGSGTLYAIVDATSTAVAALEWDLCRDQYDGGDNDERDILPPERHAAARLWSRPNPFFTQSLLVETVQQHMELAAEGYLLVVKAGKIPIELWPARPDRMQPVTSPTEYLKGWIYKAPDGEKIPFEVDEVIQIRKPSPTDFYRGLSAVAAISTDLEAERMAAQWNANFFRNSAEPGGVIELPTHLSDPQWDQFTSRWREQHGGVQKAHRVAVIEHGGKYVPRSVSQRDMQFTELRHLSRDVLMEAYRVSKTALGITDDVNRASALAARAQFAEQLTVPRARRWKEALNHQLLPMFGAPGKGVHFEFASPVEADSEAENAERDSKVTAVVALTAAGWDPTDAAAKYGLPDIQYGATDSDPDRDLMTKLVTAAPAALAPTLLPILLPAYAEQLEQAFAAQNAEPAPAEPEPSAGGEPVPPGPTNRAPVHVHDHLAWPDASTAHLPAPVRAATLDEVQQQWEAALERLMQRWPDLTAGQRTELREQIEQAIDAGDLEALATLHVDSAPTAAALTEALDDLALKAARRAVEEGAEAGAELTAQTPDDLVTVATVVAALLAADLALSAGREALRVNSPEKSGAQVATEVDTALRQRSDANPRTQVGGALTGAQNAARVATFSSGPIGSLYADETLDQNTCGPCHAIDGRFVANTDDLGPYSALYTAMGGYVGCLGGVRCRGSITGVWRPDENPDGPLGTTVGEA